MKYTSIALLSLICLSLNANAYDLKQCETDILNAEKESNTPTALYDSCGFGNEKDVWSHWAYFATLNKAGKALFEVCRRYPENVYHQVYCDRAFNTGYGPAIAWRAHDYLKKNRVSEGFKLAERAVQTGQLNKKETAELALAVARVYDRQKDGRFMSYLKQAAEKDSPEANHWLGVVQYQQSEGNKETGQPAFESIWRAILLGCPAAEENLGVFHLALQNKITFEEAKEYMDADKYSCEPRQPIDDQPKEFSHILETCDCHQVLEADESFKKMPFLLMKSDGTEALLQTTDGVEYQVRVGDNLPDQGVVAEIYKSGLIIKYPKKRVILNLYQKIDCLRYCLNHKPLKAKSDAVRIRPYRLTFTDEECETINTYAAQLVDVTQPYVGKTECYKEYQAGPNLTYQDESSADSFEVKEPVEDNSNETIERLQDLEQSLRSRRR